MNTTITTPHAAGQAAHTLLPEYKATNTAKYHIAQLVETDTGIKTWREIATFYEEARRDDVLKMITSHKALVSAIDHLVGSLDEAGLKPAGLSKVRAAINSIR